MGWGSAGARGSDPAAPPVEEDLVALLVRLVVDTDREESPFGWSVPDSWSSR